MQTGGDMRLEELMAMLGQAQAGGGRDKIRKIHGSGVQSAAPRPQQPQGSGLVTPMGAPSSKVQAQGGGSGGGIESLTKLVSGADTAITKAVADAAEAGGAALGLGGKLGAGAKGAAGATGLGELGSGILSILASLI